MNNQTYISGNENFKKNNPIKYEEIEYLSLNELLKINISDEKKNLQIETLVKNYENQLGNINQKFENKIDKIQSGDELLPGVLKLIKVSMITALSKRPLLIAVMIIEYSPET